MSQADTPVAITATPTKPDVQKYADEYVWRGDGGDYHPNQQEQQLIQDALIGFDDEVQSFIDQQQAEIADLKAQLDQQEFTSLLMRHAATNEQVAAMGAALIALQAGDLQTAESYLGEMLDAGNVCYDMYETPGEFYQRFSVDLQCDTHSKIALQDSVNKFIERINEDLERSKDM